MKLTNLLRGWKKERKQVKHVCERPPSNDWYTASDKFIQVSRRALKKKKVFALLQVEGLLWIRGHLLKIRCK